MAQKRFCHRCGKEVRCREERAGTSIRLYCSGCDRHVGTLYGHIVVQ